MDSWFPDYFFLSSSSDPFLNFSFLRLASISALRFEAIYGKNQETGATGFAAIIEGGSYESIYRSESGHRGRDGLHRVDSGRYGPGVAKADSNSAFFSAKGQPARLCAGIDLLTPARFGHSA